MLFGCDHPDRVPVQAGAVACRFSRSESSGIDHDPSH
jgi:hypothetical protein